MPLYRRRDVVESEAEEAGRGEGKAHAQPSKQMTQQYKKKDLMQPTHP